MLKRTVTALLVLAVLGAQGVSALPGAGGDVSRHACSALAPGSKLEQDRQVFRAAYGERQGSPRGEAAAPDAGGLREFRSNIIRASRNVAGALLMVGTVFLQGCLGEGKHKQEGGGLSRGEVVVAVPENRIRLAPMPVSEMARMTERNDGVAINRAVGVEAFSMKDGDALSIQGVIPHAEETKILEFVFDVAGGVGTWEIFLKGTAAEGQEAVVLFADAQGTEKNRAVIPLAELKNAGDGFSVARIGMVPELAGVARVSLSLRGAGPFAFDLIGFGSSAQSPRWEEVVAGLVNAVRFEHDARALEPLSRMGARAVLPLARAIAQARYISDYPLVEALEKLLAAPNAREDREQIVAAIKGYMTDEQKLPGVDLLANYEQAAKVLVTWLYRYRILAQGNNFRSFPNTAFIPICANDVFLSQTADMDAANRYSMAYGVYLALARFSLPVTGENIEKIVLFLKGAKTAQAGRRVLDRDTNFIMIQDAHFFSEKRVQFARDIAGTVKSSVSLMTREDGVYDAFTNKKTEMSDVLDPIGSAPPRTLLFLGGHGSGYKVQLQRWLTPREFAGALLARAGKNNGGLSDLTIVLDSCYGADFMVSVMNELAQAVARGAVRSLPCMIMTGNRDAEAWGDAFFAIFNNVWERKGSGMTLGDLMDRESDAAFFEDLAYMFPVDPERFDQFKRDLGIAGGKGTGIDASIPVVDLAPALDRFVPLMRTGGMPTEKLLADFPARAKPEAMVSELAAQGVALPPGSARTIAALQRYFAFIQKRAPGMTAEIGQFRIQFRYHVPSYAARAGNTIIIDPVLLEVDARDIVPFLAFVLGHEGSHAVMEGEAAAQEFDMVRFKGMSAAHQESVIRALSQLNADPGYIVRLLSTVALGRGHAADSKGRIDAEYTEAASGVIRAAM